MASIDQTVFRLPTPAARLSSLLMTSPANSSLVFSLDRDAPLGVNLQRRETLDRARGTFNGFLNMTSTMIGSAETEGGHTEQVVDGMASAKILYTMAK